MDDWGLDDTELTPPSPKAVDAGFEDWGTEPRAPAAPKAAADDWGKDDIVLGDAAGEAAKLPEAGHKPPSLTENFWPTRTGRFLQGLGEPILGAGQFVSHLTGVGTEYADRKAREAAELYKRSREEAGIGEGGWDIPGGLGNLMSPVAAIPAARVAKGLAAAPSLLGAAGRGLGLGALSAVEQPVAKPEEQQDYWSRKAEQAVVGGLTGAALGPVVEGAAQVALPAVQEKARKLAALGVEMTPGQLLGGFAGRLESILQSLPVVGDRVREARSHSLETNYRAAANMVLKPLGQTLPENVQGGYNIIDYLRRVVGDSFDNAYGGVTFARDRQFEAAIKGLRRDVKNSLGKEGVDDFNIKLNDILTSRTRKNARQSQAGARLDKKQTQDTISTAKKWETDLKGSKDANSQRMGQHIGDLRNALEHAIARQNPGWARQYNNAAKSYVMFTRLAQATKNPATGAFEGLATPTQILSASHALDPTLRKMVSARGMAPLQRFAGWGKDVLPNKVPDSGSPERGFVLGLLSGSLPAHAAPMAGIGLGVPAVYNDKVQRMLQRYLLSNSASQRAIAAGLRRGAFPALTESTGQHVGEGFADGGEVEQNPDSMFFDLSGLVAQAGVPPLQSKKEAAVRSYANGLTAGAWPYIEAWGKRLAGESEGESYDDMRRQAQDRVTAASEQFPEAAERAETLGALTPLGGAAKAGIGQAVTRGAGYGATAGYLAPRNPDFADIESRLESAGIGALIGGTGAGVANVAAGAGRRMLQGEYPFALSGQSRTLGSGLGGYGDGSKPDAAPMMQAVETLQTPRGEKVMPSSNFHAPTAVRFVHPESELANWYQTEQISGTQLYEMTKNAISGVKALAEYLKGSGKSAIQATEFTDWARSRFNPFSNNPRENRLLHSIQDAEAAGYVSIDPSKSGEFIRLTPLGQAAIGRFKNTRFADGGSVNAFYTV